MAEKCSEGRARPEKIPESFVSKMAERDLISCRYGAPVWKLWVAPQSTPTIILTAASGLCVRISLPNPQRTVRSGFGRKVPFIEKTRGWWGGMEIFVPGEKNIFCGKIFKRRKEVTEVRHSRCYSILQNNCFFSAISVRPKEPKRSD